MIRDRASLPGLRQVPVRPQGQRTRRLQGDVLGVLRPADGNRGVCKVIPKWPPRSASLGPQQELTDVKPKSLAKQIGNKCKHFNGLINEVCGVGVSYDSVKRQRTVAGTGLDLPCLADMCIASSCDKREFPAAAEVRARVAEIGRIFDSTVIAREAIVKHSDGKVGVVGELKCPVCKRGTLRYSIAACNGHIHAKCSSADCVAWME